MQKNSIIIALALLAGSAMADSGVEWLAAGDNDLFANRLGTDAGSLPASRHVETAPITFTWAADAGYAGQAGAQPVSVESRQYWVDVDGQTLARGIDLPTTAPGAVIRVSALNADTGLRLDADRLELAIDGIALDRSELQEVASGSDMREQGLNVPQDSLAFRLSKDAPAGLLNVRISDAPADQALVIHVFEPESQWVAHLGAPRSNFLAGQPIRLDLSLSDGSRQFQVDAAQAVLVSPDARESWALEQARNGDGLSAPAPLSSTTAQGLYEAHVYIDQRVGETLVRRDLKLAFNVAPAAGRFNGEVSRVAARDASLSLDLGVEVAASGRYQVNGEIYGTNARGQLQPLGFAQSAAVLEAGQDSISLAIDEDTLKASGLGAPFEVHNLQLLDQGRMYLLEERQRAIVVHSTDNGARPSAGR